MAQYGCTFLNMLSMCVLLNMNNYLVSMAANFGVYIYI